MVSSGAYEMESIGLMENLRRRFYDDIDDKKTESQRVKASEAAAEPAGLRL
jgi:hypothetical protein